MGGIVGDVGEGTSFGATWSEACEPRDVLVKLIHRGFSGGCRDPACQFGGCSARCRGDLSRQWAVEEHGIDDLQGSKRSFDPRSPSFEDGDLLVVSRATTIERCPELSERSDRLKRGWVALVSFFKRDLVSHGLLAFEQDYRGVVCHKGTDDV